MASVSVNTGVVEPGKIGRAGDIQPALTSRADTYAFYKGKEIAAQISRDAVNLFGVADNTPLRYIITVTPTSFTVTVQTT